MNKKKVKRIVAQNLKEERKESSVRTIVDFLKAHPAAIVRYDDKELSYDCNQWRIVQLRKYPCLAPRPVLGNTFIEATAVRFMMGK